MQTYDDVILGGGCAGLSLALRLARVSRGSRRIAVVEPRREFPRDRTWCFWRTGRHPFEAAVAHSWERWAVRAGGRRVVRGSTRYPYQQIPSDAFARLALAELARAPGVDLLLGTRAGAIEARRHAVRVETEARTLWSSRVHDGRPVGREVFGPGLLQHFVGLHVRTERPVFDPRTVTLMDFDGQVGSGIRFVYVLPRSAHEALVEATVFSERPERGERYRNSIERHLAERYGVTRFEVLDDERGVLPMTGFRPPPTGSRRIVRLGTAAGLVRPSTGYAFLAIQRWSDAWTARLASAALPAPPKARGRVTRSLDAIFVSYLRRNPELAPELFLRLFKRVPAEALVRFLSDTASWSDRTRVVAAMPTLPFLRQAWRGRAEWAQA